MSEHGEKLTNLEIENDQLRTDLKEANDKTEELEEENTTIKSDLADFESKNEVLRGRLDEIKLYTKSIRDEADNIDGLCE